MIYSYVVRTLFDDARVYDAYVAWLRDSHTGDVCMSGARDADLIVMGPDCGPAIINGTPLAFANVDHLTTHLGGTKVASQRVLANIWSPQAVAADRWRRLEWGEITFVSFPHPRDERNCVHP